MTALHARHSNLRPAAIAVISGRVVALACALLLAVIAITRDFDPFAFGQYIGMAAILLVGAFARRSSATLLALGYVFAFLLFAQLRTVADETAIPTSFEYAIQLERVLFAGVLPSAWRQETFYVPGRIAIHDYVLMATYISYFVVPHIAAVVVWRSRRDLFPRVIAAISLTFLIGLVFYFLIPTAPPWLASENGVIAEDIHRIVPELSAQVAGNVYDETSAAVGQNDVAAMPSLHTALTCTVALIMASYGRRWRWVGITYVALMATALVYLGEHYVIDEIAGIALAVGVWQLVSHHRMFAGLSTRAEAEDATSATAEDRPPRPRPRARRSIDAPVSAPC